MASKSVHKAGPLKQQNKPHKHGRHRTKGQVEDSFKGKVNVKSISKKSKSLDKKQRRHQAKQIRKNKRVEVLEKKRKIGTENSAPHVVVLFPLSSSCCCEEILEHLVASDDSIISIKKDNITTIVSPRHKQRFQIIQPKRNFYSVLDATKIADSYLFVISANEEIDEFSERCLSCIIAQGLPASIQAVQGLKNVKRQGETKKSIQRRLEKWIPDVKMHGLDSSQDAGLVLRLLGNQKQKYIHYRENRPYMLADNIEFLESVEDGMKGTLKVSGYIRGKPLSVNRLVHLPRIGDFQLKQIDLPKDPYTARKGKEGHVNKMESEGEVHVVMNEDVKTIAVVDPSKQESLVTEAEIDPMDAEQTWPTEEEIQQADEEAKAKEGQNRKLKRVPKGTSEYQAAWIVDDEENVDDVTDDDDDDDIDGDEFVQMEDSESEKGEEEEEEFDTISVADTAVANDERYDEQFDEDEEQSQLEKYRLEHENEMFPDEVDTPQDIAARIRFQRYRGLKSFRTSPWDPKENLPLDYARIFQFQNFDRTKKKILKEDDDEEGALDGWYVTLHIANVPKIHFENYDKSDPLVVFGLLPHEQKMTVMNFVVKRHPSCSLPVKSKERLIFQAGYRTFTACPIFSQHTTGDKFKGERFFPHDTVVMATVYAPILFPPSPVLVFTADHELLATGTVSGSNPDRIVVKKIVLSGHPFKIHKRSSVVRYMFFNRDDILWFKPVELFTKYGRRGNIKEPLGTHGHMKCVFNGPLKAQDTVCMNLYKRIYPKWTYEASITDIIPLSPRKTIEKADVGCDVDEDVTMK